MVGAFTFGTVQLLTSHCMNVEQRVGYFVSQTYRGLANMVFLLRHPKLIIHLLRRSTTGKRVMTATPLWLSIRKWWIPESKSFHTSSALMMSHSWKVGSDAVGDVIQCIFHGLDEYFNDRWHNLAILILSIHKIRLSHQDMILWNATDQSYRCFIL